MTPEELKQARKTLGLKARQLAPLIGYNRVASVYDMEAGKVAPHGAVPLLLQAYLDGYRPRGWPKVPEQGSIGGDDA